MLLRNNIVFNRLKNFQLESVVPEITSYKKKLTNLQILLLYHIILIGKKLFLILLITVKINSLLMNKIYVISWILINIITNNLLVIGTYHLRNKRRVIVSFSRGNWKKSSEHRRLWVSITSRCVHWTLFSKRSFAESGKYLGGNRRTRVENRCFTRYSRICILGTWIVQWIRVSRFLSKTVYDKRTF
jgi:hypothetical protein